MDEELKQLLILLFGLLLGILVAFGNGLPNHCSDDEHKCGTPFTGELSK